MKSIFIFFMKYLKETSFSYYCIIFSLAMLIPAIGLNKPYFYFVSLLFLVLFVSFTVFAFFSYFKDNQEKIEKNKFEELIQESVKFRENIKNIFNSSFKGSEFEKIFDSKIFTIIDIVNDLNKNNLQGQANYRVQNIINSSLKIYTSNIFSASKMIEATKADIDFKDDIVVLLEQNKIIISKLKEFVQKLILLNVNTQEFNDLVLSFENSLKSLDIIKSIREGR